MLAGHAAARALKAAGIPWVAGVSGESFLPLLDGLQQERIPFIQVRHESGATFMASAHARVTGKPAVVAVTRGPGASNALIGIHEAFQAGAPVVMLVGQIETRLRGRGALQEMEFTDLYRSAAKAVFEVSRPDQIAPSVLAALRKSQMGRPGPVVVSVPSDLFYGDIPETAVELRLPRAAGRTGVVPADQTGEIAEALLASRRGLILAGSAFSGGGGSALLQQVAGQIGFGVVGGHAFPDVIEQESPLWLGCSTVRGSPALKETLRQADLILVLGHWLGDRVTQGYLPLTARILVVKGDMEVGWDEYLEAEIYCGEPIQFLHGLQSDLAGRPAAQEGTAARASWLAGRVQSHREEDHAILSAALAADSAGVPFPQILTAVDSLLPAGSTIVSDAGSFNDWFIRYLPFSGDRFYCGPLSGSMGFAIPGALGAQMARPTGRTLALTGDGGFQMSMMELGTIAQMGVPLTVIVFDNGVWGSIALHQDKFFPQRRNAIALKNPSFAAIAGAYGARGFSVSAAEELEPALSAAFATDGLSVVEIKTDANAPSPASYQKSW